MSALKNFFRTIWSSATAPSTYLKLRKFGMWQGILYLYFILLITSLIVMIPFFWNVFGATPQLQTFVGEAKQEVMHLYPPGLVLTITDGTLTTNVPEPYYIEPPPRWKAAWMQVRESSESSAVLQRNYFEHLVAIDTNGRAEEYANYHSLLLFTKTAVVTPDKNGTFKLTPYATFGRNMTITAAKVNLILAKILPYADFIMPFFVTFWVVIIIVLPFAFAGFRLLGYFLYFAVMSVVLLLLAMIMGRKTGYGELYKLSYWGITLPLAYGTLASLFDMTVPFAFTLIFLVWMGIVISKLPKKKT